MMERFALNVTFHIRCPSLKRKKMVIADPQVQTFAATTLTNLSGSA
ncbi:hypothetical protein [Acetobacterium sp. KB-1]|jgi:hypothetical protein|nr:hypothetical protein [Acetobacterium sp. KB-1]